LRATHERAFAGIAEVDLRGRFLRANARFCEITGYSADELLNCGFGSITHPEDVGLDMDNFAALVSGQTDTYQTEKRFLRKDGTTIWVAVSASIVRDDHGQPLYGIRIVQDITELKRSQARQKLLLDELNHRVKNMLATVQSVAMQTRRRATDLDGFTQAFEGRLMALNRAHELLTREIGTGGRLRDLLLETVAPYEDAAGERFRLRGPEIRLGSEVAVTLAMALHELTTNAAKYGALSTPQGCISIEWRNSAPDSLTMDWAETGGPPVVKPTRRGFGSDLIERGLARQSGGTAILEFHKGGVRCHIACMLPQRGDSIA
jgi:PAS domain S-box-containing protein